MKPLDAPANLVQYMLDDVAELPNQETSLLSHNERTLVKLCKRLASALAMEKAFHAPPGTRAVISYTNHRGVTAMRELSQARVVLNDTKGEWHPKEPWLIHAYDVDKQAYRSFDPSSIHSWGWTTKPR